MIKHDCAVVSNVIRDMIKSGTAWHPMFRTLYMLCMVFNFDRCHLTSGHCCADQYLEGKEGKCTLREIRAPILEKICQYFYYKLQYNTV